MKSIIYLIHEPFIYKIKEFNESIKTIPADWDLYITTSGVVDVEDHKYNLDQVIERDYHYMLLNDYDDIDYFNKKNMISETIKKVKTENIVLTSGLIDFSNFKDDIIEKESYIGLVKTSSDLALKNIDVIFTNKKTYDKYYETYEKTNVYDKLGFIFNYLRDNNLLYFYKNLELVILQEESSYGFSFDSFIKFNKQDLIQKSCCLSSNDDINKFYKYKEIL